MIITVAPTAPLDGLKIVIVGVGKTVKTLTLVTVTPLVVTEIIPSVAPTGTVVVILVAIEVDTTAVTPLNLTTGDGLKLVPVMITVEPSAPALGVKPEIVGVGNTVKLVILSISIPTVVILIFPVVAPTGTVVIIRPASEEVTVAATSLKKTDGAGPKLLPVMVTVAPTAPLVGLKLAITGVGNTVKTLALATVTPLVVTVIVPVDAPAGTVVVILLVVDEVTVATTSLNATELFAAMVLKFVPSMVTVAPTAPLTGL